MDFSFSEEQTLLRNSLQRMLQDNYDFESRKGFIGSEDGFSRDIWNQFAELGVLAMPFSEEDGGFGYGAVETMIVMEELGSAIAIDPYLSTVVLGGGLLRHGGSAAQRAELIPGVTDGSKHLAFGFAERGGRFNLAHVQTQAKADGDGYVLTGEKAVVLWGGAADTVFVTARTSGELTDKDGITVFAIPGNAAGMSRRVYPTIDGMRSAEINLDGVKLGADAVVGEVGGGYALASTVVDEATVALCAEANGNMRTLHQMTLEYAKQRKQFGQNISRFQVIQHRLVDIMICCEEAISNTYMATLMVGENNAASARAVSAAKAMVGKSARFVGQEAVQIHGGMGVTHEMPAAHYFKRLTTIEPMFGNTDYHLRRFAAAG